MFDLDTLVRDNIRRLKPYSSARHEFAGSAEIYLDANENAFGSPIDVQLNRYPDPMQTEVKRQTSKIKQVSPDRIFLGNGSDEAIDLLYRIFCEPGRDEVIISPPTYGMYRVSADINNVTVKEVPLTEDFQLDVAAIKSAIDETTKLIFICSPNNPTGNAMRREDMLELAGNFAGIVVVDEAYIDFSSQPSLTVEIDNHPNFVILQTFSKAWGLAGARIGLAFAIEEIINLFNRVKPPYNLSQLAQTAVLDAMSNQTQVQRWITDALEERNKVAASLSELDYIKCIYPSDANFLLVKVTDANGVYKYLINQKIVVRNRSNVLLCEDCLRVTVGTLEENDQLFAAMKTYSPSLTTEN
jgi:histidinol-phosphate aminotransferase